MKSELINRALRKYVQKYLTPTAEERRLISLIYSELCSVLGRNRCLQIGSYPRYTAIRPPHDLDVLYITGDWDGTEPNATGTLATLKARLEEKFVSPGDFVLKVSLQTHSVTIQFFRNGNEIFAVDIVPALIADKKNEFDDDIYLVPEILQIGHKQRLQKYQRVAENIESIDWILSDPRGYISIASMLNKQNDDFRKSVKLPKKWKCLASVENDHFKLKSFHIEQIITTYFKKDSTLTILPAVTRFFEDLPVWLTHSQIPDRADPLKNIDSYVDDLTVEQKALILNVRDDFLEKLGSFEGFENAQILFEEPPVTVRAKAAGSGIVGTSTSIETRRVSPRAPFGD